MNNSGLNSKIPSLRKETPGMVEKTIALLIKRHQQKISMIKEAKVLRG